MDNRTRAALGEIIDGEISFLDRMYALASLLTVENAADVTAELPKQLVEEFAAYATVAFAPETGPRTVYGAPLPEASLNAIRIWLRLRGLESQLHIEHQKLPSVRPTSRARVVEQGHTDVPSWLQAPAR